MKEKSSSVSIPNTTRVAPTVSVSGLLMEPPEENKLSAEATEVVSDKIF